MAPRIASLVEQPRREVCGPVVYHARKSVLYLAFIKSIVNVMFMLVFSVTVIAKKGGCSSCTQTRDLRLPPQLHIPASETVKRFIKAAELFKIVAVF